MRHNDQGISNSPGKGIQFSVSVLLPCCLSTDEIAHFWPPTLPESILKRHRVPLGINGVCGPPSPHRVIGLYYHSLISIYNTSESGECSKPSTLLPASSREPKNRSISHEQRYLTLDNDCIPFLLQSICLISQLLHSQISRCLLLHFCYQASILGGTPHIYRMRSILFGQGRC